MRVGRVVLTLNYPEITAHTHTQSVYILIMHSCDLRCASFWIRNLIPSSFVWYIYNWIYEFSFCSWQSDCSQTRPKCSTFNWLIHLNHFTLFLIELRKWFALSRTFSDAPTFSCDHVPCRVSYDLQCARIPFRMGFYLLFRMRRLVLCIVLASARDKSFQCIAFTKSHEKRNI